MEYTVGKSVEWNPLDESASSYYVGHLLFGKEQRRIREMVKAQKVPASALRVAKVCQQTNTVTLEADE